MWPYLRVCSCSFLESLAGKKGKFWALQAAPGSSGQIDSVISATARLSSNTSGFSICNEL